MSTMEYNYSFSLFEYSSRETEIKCRTLKGLSNESHCRSHDDGDFTFCNDELRSEHNKFIEICLFLTDTRTHLIKGYTHVFEPELST